MKHIRTFIYSVLVVKFSIYLIRRVFVMAEELTQQTHTIATTSLQRCSRCVRRLWRKQEESWLEIFRMLLQDDAPGHTSQVALAAATKCKLEIFPHPPYMYSADLAPSNFCLFPNLKTCLRGTNFGRDDLTWYFVYRCCWVLGVEVGGGGGGGGKKPSILKG